MKRLITMKITEIRFSFENTLFFVFANNMRKIKTRTSIPCSLQSIDKNDKKDIKENLMNTPLKQTGLNLSKIKQFNMKNKDASISARPTIDITGSV